MLNNNLQHKPVWAWSSVCLCWHLSAIKHMSHSHFPTFVWHVPHESSCCQIRQDLCVCTKQESLHAQTDVRASSQYQRRYRFIFIFFTINHCWTYCCTSLTYSLRQSWKWRKFPLRFGRQPCIRLKDNLIDSLFYCYAHKNELRV